MSRLVIVESPYAGDLDVNVTYARECVRDSLMRGESPIASHLLYTQIGILDDDIPEERQRGIDAGLAWRRVADASVVYTDLGISRGMEYGIAAAKDAGIPVEYRSIKAAGYSAIAGELGAVTREKFNADARFSLDAQPEKSENRAGREGAANADPALSTDG